MLRNIEILTRNNQQNNIMAIWDNDERVRRVPTANTLNFIEYIKVTKPVIMDNKNRYRCCLLCRSDRKISAFRCVWYLSAHRWCSQRRFHLWDSIVDLTRFSRPYGTNLNGKSANVALNVYPGVIYETGIPVKLLLSVLPRIGLCEKQAI
jgi:hypothetical protein